MMMFIKAKMALFWLLVENLNKKILSAAVLFYFVKFQLAVISRLKWNKIIFVSDIAVFVLKRDVKLQLTNK